MPRNVLKGRSDRDLAAEYAIRTTTFPPPVKLYSSFDIYKELKRRHSTQEAVDALIKEATNIAQILGD